MRSMEDRIARLELQTQDLHTRLTDAVAALEPARADLANHAQRIGAVEVLVPSGGSTWSELVDKKLLNKPSYFHGTQETWADWAFVFRAYIGATDEQLKADMDRSAGLTTTILHADQTHVHALPRCTTHYVSCHGTKLYAR